MDYVWILEGSWDYEGSEIIAVYDNEEAAIVAGCYTHGYDHTRVKRYDVHSTAKAEHVAGCN